jgi:D-alanyl-D-alanine carboxypeptidase
MYTTSQKASYRNKSTTHFQKKDVGNTRTFSRIRAAQENFKLQQKSTPLFISAKSWIVITPDAFNHLKPTNISKKASEKSIIKAHPLFRLQKAADRNRFLETESEPIMYGSNYHKVREIASLTKIMTWYTILKLMEKYSLNKHTTLITISKNASQIIGTTSLLQEGHMLSAWDLLHGLMLPSGNDAAIALSEYFGKLLLSKEKKKDSPLAKSQMTRLMSTAKDFRSPSKKESDSLFPAIKWKCDDSTADYSFSDMTSSCNDTSYSKDLNKSSWMDSDVWSRSFTDSFPINLDKGEFRNWHDISRFIKEMNKHAENLGMTNSHFDSPHGLQNKNNVSTAYDIALLWSVCINISEFNRIVRTKSYKCKSRNKPIMNLWKVMKMDYLWWNTNKLLNRGFVGIKTGITYPAGPCLATHLKKKKRSYLVILLNSKSIEQRWVDTCKVIEYWQMKIRYGMIGELKPSKIQNLKILDTRKEESTLDIDEDDIQISNIQTTDKALCQNPTQRTLFVNSKDVVYA